MTTSLWFDNWRPHSPLANSYGERFIYDDSGMGTNARVNVLISNSEWRIPTTQSIGWHPIIEAIPSNPKMGQKDEIVWLDSPHHRFSATVYYIWQERNARIFSGMSRTPNLVFDQIECIIREKLDLMRKALPTDENIRIQSAWRVNNIDS